MPPCCWRVLREMSTALPASLPRGPALRRAQDRVDCMAMPMMCCAAKTAKAQRSAGMGDREQVLLGHSERHAAGSQRGLPRARG